MYMAGIAIIPIIITPMIPEIDAKITVIMSKGGSGFSDRNRTISLHMANEAASPAIKPNHIYLGSGLGYFNRHQHSENKNKNRNNDNSNAETSSRFQGLISKTGM